MFRISVELIVQFFFIEEAFQKFAIDHFFRWPKCHGWKKNTHAVLETCFPRHNGGPVKGPLTPLNTISFRWSEGFQGGPQFFFSLLINVFLNWHSHLVKTPYVHKKEGYLFFTLNHVLVAYSKLVKSVKQKYG